MNQFNDNIKIDDEDISFSFNRIFTPSGERFFIGVFKGRKFTLFHMQADENGKWKFTEPVAEWLKPLEGKLSELILRHA